MNTHPQESLSKARLYDRAGALIGIIALTLLVCLPAIAIAAYRWAF
jgi:hypothetical protein